MRTPGSEPLVSVVTPVYNEEKNLAECIESILAQSYKNWEYTILDNCSTDSSPAIAERYASLDRRIRVVRNEHFLSSLANCNQAVRLISPAGKYCKVVFGDDWIFPDCLSSMVDVAESYPSVGLVSAYALEGSNVVLTGLPFETKILTGRDACRRHLLDRHFFFGTQTSVLYRADLVRSRDPLYDESNVQADTETCFALLRSSDFGFVHQVLTFTRVRPGSLNVVSMSLGSSWAALLNLLITYGEIYLTQEEREQEIDRHLRQYYEFLGKSALKGRDQSFWKYHKTQLATVGVGFSRSRVVLGGLTALMKAALNPGNSLSAAIRSVRERRGR